MKNETRSEITSLFFCGELLVSCPVIGSLFVLFLFCFCFVLLVCLFCFCFVLLVCLFGLVLGGFPLLISCFIVFNRLTVV